MPDLEEIANSIADMISEKDFCCGCSYGDIELVLQAFAHLGIRDFEVKDNLFNDD